MLAPANRDCAMARACERSSRSIARRMPAVKSSNPVASTIESSRNATTTSTSVKPAPRLAERGRPRQGGGPSFPLVANGHPPREPVHVHEVLSFAGGQGDAPARGAAVRIEADGALAF